MYMKVFVNKHSGESIVREEPKDTYVPFDGTMMIVEMDRDGIITYTNRKFRDITGYSRDELIGLPYDISHHPDMPSGICQQAFDVASEGKIWAGYIKSISRTGESFWTDVCVQPKFDIDKNLTGYIINKKPAKDEIIDEVKKEFARLKASGESLIKSEYCGELYNG